MIPVTKGPKVASRIANGGGAGTVAMTEEERKATEREHRGGRSRQEVKVECSMVALCPSSVRSRIV